MRTTLAATGGGAARALGATAAMRCERGAGNGPKYAGTFIFGHVRHSLALLSLSAFGGHAAAHVFNNLAFHHACVLASIILLQLVLFLHFILLILHAARAKNTSRPTSVKTRGAAAPAQLPCSTATLPPAAENIATTCLRAVVRLCAPHTVRVLRRNSASRRALRGARARGRWAHAEHAGGGWEIPRAQSMRALTLHQSLRRRSFRAPATRCRQNVFRMFFIQS